MAGRAWQDVHGSAGQKLQTEKQQQSLAYFQSASLVPHLDEA